MASEQHITLLRQGFKVWNLWRQQNPQIIPDLKRADLTGLKLFKVDLSGADLSEADFGATSLYRANLSGANLYKADLSWAILQEADLSGASLIEANLKDKNFSKTNLSGANLSRANLSGAKFYITNLDNTNFSWTNLSGLNLSGLNLRSNNFTGANLSGTNLEHVNLREAQIQEAIIDEKWYLVWDIVNNGADKRYLQGVDLSMANLEGANLCEADLSNVNLRGTKLNGANLAKSNLVRANLSKTDLSRANLSMANLSKANLLQADLRGVGLSGANLSKANLRYANLQHTRIQEAIIDQKWYLVWDIVNNGAEGRDLSGVDLSEANLSETNFKNGNLSGSDLSKSILRGADFSRADLSKVNFRKANLAGANFDWADFWADFSEADFSEVEGFGSITFGGASLNKADGEVAAHTSAPVRDSKEFFENLLSWKNQEVFNESLKKSLSLSKKSFIPGVLLYTDEDAELSLYIREHFDAFDKLTGDWCTIYLLESPSPKWRQANHSWREMVKYHLWLNASWFRSKPYDKSEAYDIARQLDIESSNLPCLVLISPANLSEKLVLQIREVSPEYFRKLFSTLDKLVQNVSSKQLRQGEVNSQVFDCLKLNFNEIVSFLEKYANKQQENANTKYILKGDNIFVSIEPVNIGNNVQGDYTDQSRNLTVGDFGGDFKPVGSALMADDFRASGTVADSINFDQGITKEAELQNPQDEKSSKPTGREIFKFSESKSIGRVVGVIVIVLALFSGLAVYVFFQVGSSKHPASGPSQEQRIKE